MWHALDALHVVALESAAHGCVSGSLSEWPFLAAAFKALNMDVSEDAGIVVMRQEARFAWERLRS